MSNKRLIWAILGFALVGAVGYAAAVLGGVTSSRPPGPAAPQSASAAAAPATSSPAAAGPSPSGATSAGPSTAQGKKLPAPTSVGPKLTPSTITKQPVKPKPSGPPLKDGVSAAGAVTFLALKGFSAPQTYAAVVVPQGWSSKSAGQLIARVASVHLAGPIDAATGQETGPPAAGTPNHSDQISGITLLAATNPAVRGDITNKQSYKVNIVLLPSGNGAVFIVDRLR